MNFKKENFAAYIRLTRPLNCLITFVTVIVAAFISNTGNMPVFLVLLTALTAALTAAGGNIHNDIVDVRGDEINHPFRPIPSGVISLKKAFWFFTALTFISALLSAYISYEHLIINLICIILLLFYSIFFKRIPFVGNVVVSFLTGMVFIYGGMTVHNASFTIVPAVFAFLINLIREIVKDMQDKEGDEKQGVITFPIRFGFSKSKHLILFITTALIFLTIYPYWSGMYDLKYLVVVLFVVNPVLLYFIYKLYVDDKTLSLYKLSFLLKINMIFGLFAIYIGK